LELLQQKAIELNIENDVMSFDYKLREGVTKNMNALFLMKQIITN
jgi:hypothetical protein